MPLGTKVGIGPGHIVLDGDSFPHKRGTAAPTFRPMYIVTVWLDGSKCHLVRGSRPRPRLHYVIEEDPASPTERAQQPPIPLSAHVYGGQTAGWIKMPLGTEAGLGLGNTVLDGDPPAPRKEAQQLHSTFAVQTAAHVYCRETVAHLS